MSFIASECILWIENYHYKWVGTDFSAGYAYCEVRYTTHAIGGLSENDFICAAKINDLLEP